MIDFNNRRLEIDSLRALWAIRHHGGVTRAAEALGLSQSAVSHKIKRLETSLGCNLLHRKPGAPMFTGAGEDLLDYAGRIIGLHDEALLSLSRTTLAGRIALGLTEDTTCSDLARILGRFHRLHPAVSVRTKVRMSLVLRAMLERGELDAAIMQVFAHDVRPSDLVLFKEKLHWVKHPNFSLPQSGAIRFLSFDDECFYRQWALDIGQDDGVTLETVFECSSSAGIIAAVSAGMGIALLNERHLRSDMEIITGCLPAPPALTYVVRRARKARNPVLDALVAEIGSEIRRYGGLSIAI
ncbi:LysR family transcriptional regulator [Rhizobium sp. PL01]|uniref:LysR family transcriptional regulator n=1 Tax=Rhizobium sp. PL01 TaxID=3085631 RepID=UPI002981A996|nr:LysR family transcriptional regulator [Rhizobium sp. PL01]MDW5312527.1 LysR family transcriptional regulator [Rhizobium sp. PL01]